MRVLLLSQDTAIRDLLERDGAMIDKATTSEELLSLATSYDYDVALVDAAQGDSCGHEVVREARASRVDTPLLVLGSDRTSPLAVKALSLGADDFVARPFHEAELLARIRALVRRSNGHSQSALRAGMLTLDLNTRKVEFGGEPVRLTGKEYALLELLMLRKGMVMNKERMLDHLYGAGDAPEARIIDTFVCALRRKLGRVGAGNLIVTVWGQGYKLSAATETAAATESSYRARALPST